ncbi:MAG TPA: DUF2628 domain-containing protein [Bradyrhizobium sp.]|jgi:hypothetical protein
MPVYTVHGPQAYAADLRATDKFVFVRDGFHFWAMVLGPLWLIAKRLWLALLGWLVLVIGLEVAVASLRGGRLAVLVVGVILAILMGLEASTLQRWSYSRRKWRQLDVVVADDEESAERRFFDRWTAGPGKRWSGYDPLSVDRGGPPPTRDVPGQRFSEPPMPQGGIIGLFPEPGGSR